MRAVDERPGGVDGDGARRALDLALTSAARALVPGGAHISAHAAHVSAARWAPRNRPPRWGSPSRYPRRRLTTRTRRPATFGLVAPPARPSSAATVLVARVSAVPIGNGRRSGGERERGGTFGVRIRDDSRRASRRRRVCGAARRFGGNHARFRTATRDAPENAGRVPVRSVYDPRLGASVDPVFGTGLMYDTGWVETNASGPSSAAPMDGGGEHDARLLTRAGRRPSRRRW